MVLIGAAGSARMEIISIPAGTVLSPRALCMSLRGWSALVTQTMAFPRELPKTSVRWPPWLIRLRPVVYLVDPETDAYIYGPR